MCPFERGPGPARNRRIHAQRSTGIRPAARILTWLPTGPNDDADVVLARGHARHRAVGYWLLPAGCSVAWEKLKTIKRSFQLGTIAAAQRTGRW